MFQSTRLCCAFLVGGVLAPRAARWLSNRSYSDSAKGKRIVRYPFLGACATVVMPASMCEDVVKDNHLEHRAIGCDMHLHCRPSTASVTTRKDHAYRETMGASPLNPGACDRWSQSYSPCRRSYGVF